jgi:AcrR family transcriptional regulator
METRMKPRKNAAERTSNAEMSAESRARIVEATKASLAELGYAGTTMSGIAQRIGLTRAALIYHFESKYSLMAAVANSIYDEMAGLFAAGAPPSLTPKERILALLEVAYDMTDSVNQTALIELLLAARRDPAFRAEVAGTIERRDRTFDESWRQMVAQLPADADRLNLLRDLSVSVYRGMTISRSLGDSTTFEHQHAVLRRLLLDALGSRAGAPKTGRRDKG